jgi:hypothetical protein
MRQRLFFPVIFLLALAGCHKDSQEISGNEIIYQEFTIDHSKVTNDTVYYDYNSDLVNDIAVTKQIDTVNGTIHYSGRIFSMKEDILFTYMQISPEYAMLDTNDIITNSNEFQWMDTIKYAGSIPYIAGNTSWPYGVFTKYFGFQVRRMADTINYGWFHLEFFVFKELGYNFISNSPIRVGQKK